MASGLQPPQLTAVEAQLLLGGRGAAVSKSQFKKSPFFQPGFLQFPEPWQWCVRIIITTLQGPTSV
jgi:hypothetical protein